MRWRKRIHDAPTHQRRGRGLQAARPPLGHPLGRGWPAALPRRLRLQGSSGTGQDMYAKGRDNYPWRVARTPRGSAHPEAKVTEGQVAEIRTRHQAGETHAALAAEFGLSKPSVAHMCQLRTWKHVANGPATGQRHPPSMRKVPEPTCKPGSTRSDVTCPQNATTTVSPCHYGSDGGDTDVQPKTMKRRR